MINNLGSFVRKIRGTSSLREFARKIGISHTHLDTIEKGVDFRTGKRVSITLDTFGRLAIALNTSISELLQLAVKDGLLPENSLNIKSASELTRDFQTKHEETILSSERKRLFKELCDADDETVKEIEKYLNYLKSRREQAATGTEI